MWYIENEYLHYIETNDALKIKINDNAVLWGSLQQRYWSYYYVNRIGYVQWN